MLLAAAALIVVGAFLVLVAAIGVVRLPDLFMRMHAATKAGALGTGLLLLSAAFVHGELGVSLRVLAAIVFLFLTAPVAAHAIGRAAYLSGEVRLWDGTFVDELRGVAGRAAAGPEGAGEALIGGEGVEKRRARAAEEGEGPGPGGAGPGAGGAGTPRGGD